MADYKISYIGDNNVGNVHHIGVDLICGRYTIDAKSLMAIFSVSLNNKLKLVIHSDDEDEIRRFNEIAEEFK